MSQQQIRKRTGSQYHLNLDSISFAALCACQQTFRNHSQNFSNSVIVRRAVRAYLERLEIMSSQIIEQEIVQTNRAAKGVL